MSETPQTPDTNIEFSGPYDGDERDPVLLSDAIKELMPELAQRRAETTALSNARAALIDAENRIARGEQVSPHEMARLKAEVMELEPNQSRPQAPDDSPPANQ